MINLKSDFMNSITIAMMHRIMAITNEIVLRTGAEKKFTPFSVNVTPSLTFQVKTQNAKMIQIIHKKRMFRFNRLFFSRYNNCS